jgi:tripartite-type tricarboxylate transporter receptor subunit TctC
MRRALLCLALSLACTVGARAQGTASAWPTRPIHMVVAFAPGGPADIVARLLGIRLTEVLGQPVVVENRGGAGGNIGAQAVAKAAPDGYTVLVTTSALAVNVSLFAQPGYDAEKDFIPVAAVATQPNMIVVNPALPVKSIAELIEWARTNKAAFATPGSGTTPHLTAENLFRMINHLDMPAIHFRGAGPAVAAVVAGEPAIGSAAIASPLPHVKAGKLRALAVSSASRVPALPDVPTLTELGFPIEDSTWVGLFLPAGTPPAIAQKLNEAVNRSLQNPELKASLDAQAFQPVGGTQREFGDYVRTEIVKWGKVVKAGKIQPE